MTAFKKGNVIKGAELLEPTTVRGKGRNYPAWICRINGETIKIIKQCDFKRRKGNRTPPMQASLNRTYAHYRRRCRLKNIYFEISVKDFHAISQRPCTYCAKPPSNGGGKREIYVYNGLDRKNNAKGYTRANCVACCAHCNAIKSNLLTYDEMLAAMGAVMRLRKKK